MLSTSLKRKMLQTKSQPAAEAKISTTVFEEDLIKKKTTVAFWIFSKFNTDERASQLIWKSLFTAAYNSGSLNGNVEIMLWTLSSLQPSPKNVSIYVLITVFSQDTYPNSRLGCSAPKHVICTLLSGQGLFFIAILWLENKYQGRPLPHFTYAGILLWTC